VEASLRATAMFGAVTMTQTCSPGGGCIGEVSRSVGRGNKRKDEWTETPSACCDEKLTRKNITIQTQPNSQDSAI
jgi:hypothetical protein